MHCTSVTEQWATFPLVGPRSRDVLAAARPGPRRLQRGVPVHDLAGHHARRRRRRGSAGSASPASWPTRSTSAAWDGLARVGGAARGRRSRYGITPYGTETMHVLRAEKGYPIIGQDTDGTVTPQDLGMGWAVSKKKPDFIGKRSFSRPDNQRPDRKQLVGLLPDDPTVVLPEGSQIVECRRQLAPRRRCRCSGTSPRATAARRWAAPFALALIALRPGPDRPDPATPPSATTWSRSPSPTRPLRQGGQPP